MVYSEQDDKAVKDAVLKGQYQLVFIGPESLIRNLQWREMLRSDTLHKNLVGLAVDEAHCITKWYIFILSSTYFQLNFPRGNQRLVSENKDSRVEGLSFYSTIFGVKKPLLW